MVGVTDRPSAGGPVGAGHDRLPPVRRPRRGRQVLLALAVLIVLAGAVTLSVLALQPGRHDPLARPTTPATLVPPGGRLSGTGSTTHLLDQRISVYRQLDKSYFAASWAVMSSTVLLVGMAIFLLIIFPAGRSERSPLEEHGRVRTLAKLAAAVVVLGEVVQVLLRAAISADLGWRGAIDPDALVFVLAGPVAVACLLRSAGVLIILAMLVGHFSAVKRPFTIARGGISLIGGVQISALTSRRVATLVGLAVTLASFAVIGHAQASSPRALLIIADLTHVVAASVWFGGVAMIMVMLRRLRRLTRATPDPTADPTVTRLRRQMAAATGRFSLAATAAVVSVAVAGTALGVSQLKAPEDLVRTAYGITLAVKLALVAFVMLLGGYNHRFVVPRVVENETDERAWRRLRRVVTVETFVIVFGVLVATVALASGGFANIVR